MRRLSVVALILTAVLTSLISSQVHAAAIPAGDFSLEVSPSPLAATVKPGQPVTLDLKVRNASRQTEQLKIEARSFRIAYPDQNIVISATTPQDLASWISYSNPTFTVKPGEWYTQKVTVSLPEQAGFSYPFILVISRVNDAPITISGQLIKGSIGVFTLINIDKPGATRKLEVADFKPERPIYEYLPSTFTLKLRNTGNSIVQPYGNLFIQRRSDDDTPLSVLPVNDARSYILPGNTKEVKATWADGFPVYKPGPTGKDGAQTQILKWDWKEAGKIRFGRYTAKVVAVYNDGTRDVPIVGEVSFWVIPWRMLLVALLVCGLVGLGIWSLIRPFLRRFSRLKKHRQ